MAISCAISDFKLSGKRETRDSPGADSFRIPRSNVPPQIEMGSQECMDEYHLTLRDVHEFSFRLLCRSRAGLCDDGHPGSELLSISRVMRFRP
jgi:hypothetical protein